MSVALFLIVVGVIVFLAVQFSKAKEDVKKLEERARALIAEPPNFKASRIEMNPQGLLTNGGVVCLALDEQARRLALVSRTFDGVHADVVDAKQIVSAELIEDGITVNRSQRNWGLTRAATLGLLTGGAGAVVGAVTASQTTTSNTTMDSLALRLVVDDLKAPIREITFWKQNTLLGKTAKTDPIYRAASQQARQWEAIVSVLIRRAEHATGAPNSPISPRPLGA